MPTLPREALRRTYGDDDGARDVAHTKTLKDRRPEISGPSTQTPSVLQARSSTKSRALPSSIDVEIEPTKIDSTSLSEQLESFKSSEANIVASQATQSQRRPNRRVKKKNKNKQQSHQDAPSYQTNVFSIPILPLGSTATAHGGLDSYKRNTFAAAIEPAVAEQATALFHCLRNDQASEEDSEALPRKQKRGN